MGIEACTSCGEPETSLDAKLRFLQAPSSHPDSKPPLDWLETHMSWLFFAGDRVLKLKKPVRFPFLDFSTLPAREFYCREELRLNARLAPGVYLGLMALQRSRSGLALVPEDRLPGTGQTVDWLVLMRRLPTDRMLSQRIAEARVEPRDIDALTAVLAAFYRRAPKVGVTPQEYVARFQREQAANREVLLRPQFALRGAAPALTRFDAALVERADLLHDRAERSCVVDGHGDLRPEHVCLLAPPVVIDCLEFNAQLRQVDPFDEIAFLALECEIAGAPWIGPRLAAGCAAALGEMPPPALMQLYTAHRALLRARLAMAHLLDPQPRTPQKWPPLAQRYIERALAGLDAPPATTSLSGKPPLT
jgi:aminoglycoside phosphotransferase family enzyme